MYKRKEKQAVMIKVDFSLRDCINKPDSVLSSIYVALSKLVLSFWGCVSNGQSMATRTNQILNYKLLKRIYLMTGSFFIFRSRWD